MARSIFAKAVTQTDPLPAPAPQVFTSLLEWASFPEWNPYITRIEGRPEVGAGVRVFFSMGLGPRMPLDCTMVTVNPAQGTLAWDYKAFLPFLYTARHVFTVSAEANGSSRITQTEDMKGLIACPIFGFFHRLLQQRFQAMHAALKERIAHSAA